MIKTKKQMYLVIGAFALVMLLGSVTYAFFNYTRTGAANVIRTGRISFATNQTDTISLTNAFPITRTMAATDTTNTDDVVITISGDTDYSGGVEYLVTVTNVTNTVGSGQSAKTIPISIIPTVSNLGTSNDSYYTNRGGNSSIYKVLANETVSNNDQILVGYIAPDNNQTGVNGSITIRAFLDSDLVAISDTTPEEQEDTNNDGYLNGTTTNWVNGRTVFTTEEWNSLQNEGISFKVKIEANEGIWVKQIPVMSLSANSGTVTAGSNTTATITTTGDGIISCQSSDTSTATCSVDTTNNTLTVNGLAAGTATITVNQAAGTNYEGTSVTYGITVEPRVIPTIASCPGCVYVYPNNNWEKYYYSSSNSNNQPQSTKATIVEKGDTIYDDYSELMNDKNKKSFLGFKINDTTNIIEKAYACGVKQGTPNAGVAFCVEGTLSPTYGGNATTVSTVFTANKNLITGSTLWNDSDFTFGRCYNSSSSVDCGVSNGMISYVDSTGYVSTEFSASKCEVSAGGIATCGEF